MRYAIMNGNTVANIVIADSPMHSNWVALGDDSASIGWSRANNQWVAPTQQPPSAGKTLSVSMRQARLALAALGLYAQVDAVIEALPTPQRITAKIEWEYATTVERSSPMLTLIASALELTEADLDALFTAAAVL